MSERCHRCDRPKATREDYGRYEGGEGGHLCWGGQCPEVDWRARALPAEERLAAMIQQGDRVDVLGGGQVVTVYGPASKRMASVKTDRGDYVEVECAKCTVLPPAFKVGDWVTARWNEGQEETGPVRSIAHGHDGSWIVQIDTANGGVFGAYSRHCTPAPDLSNPMVRYASLIADAETCVLDGPATEQAKAIAAMAKALRESQAQCEEAKRTLRSIVELAR